MNQDGARSGLRLPRVATRVQAQNREEFLYRVWGNKGRFSLQEDALARRDEELGLVRKPPGKKKRSGVNGKSRGLKPGASLGASAPPLTPHVTLDP